MNGWFPRLNLQGEVASGYGQVYVGDRLLLDPGFKPQWFDKDRIVALGANDWLYKVNVRTGVVSDPRSTSTHPLIPTEQDHLAPENHIWAAGGGRWKVREGDEIALAFDQVTGRLVREIEHGNDNNDRSIYLEDVPLVTHLPVHDIRAHDGLVVWTEVTRWPDRGVWGWDGVEIRHLRVTPLGTWQGAPVPIRMGDGTPWLLFQTNTDLRIHPWGSTQGYVIRTGEDRNFNPDAMGLGENLIRFAWQDAQGAGSTRDFLLSEPREDVSFGAAPPIIIRPPLPQELPMYRDGQRDILPYLVFRWNELGIPAATLALSARGVTDEEEYKAIQIPAFIQIVGELHHEQGMMDVGLSTKRSGNNWQGFATDVITLKPINGNGQPIAGNFTLVDALVSAGSADCVPTWHVLGPNTDPARPWAAPPIPAEDIPQPDPVDATHRYDGGGNDTGTCDVCGQPRADVVHATPASKVPHFYDGGEQDTGECDVCGKTSTDPIHRGVGPIPVPVPVPPSTDPSTAAQLAIMLKLVGTLTKTVDDLEARVSALEDAPPAALDGLIVSGTTERSSWHSHRFTGIVRRE